MNNTGDNPFIGFEVFQKQVNPRNGKSPNGVVGEGPTLPALTTEGESSSNGEGKIKGLSEKRISSALRGNFKPGTGDMRDPATPSIGAQQSRHMVHGKVPLGSKGECPECVKDYELGPESAAERYKYEDKNKEWPKFTGGSNE
jgi:hypothetical protein|tara:strand:- start:338 stop:766 length:429 start_codon:yes stop_codon:yes gene_type:complete